MSFGGRYRASLMLVAALLFAGGGAVGASLDINGDGAVRVALLSTEQHPGGVSAGVIAADLEQGIRSVRWGRSGRVVVEVVSRERSLLGWWYHPDNREAREQLLQGRHDLLLLAESEEVVGRYPELFFEGVRVISEAAAEEGIRCVVVSLARPAESFRDRRSDTLNQIAYRVGDGCGVHVVPAMLGWREALARNRISGNSPVRGRAYSFITAAAIFCDLSGERWPKGALESDWTTKRQLEPLALSAREAVQRARVTRQYAGAFRGVVRMESVFKPRLKLYTPGSAAEDALRLNLESIFDTAFQEWFWRSSAEWYHEGFDRNTCPFDMVIGDRRQMGSFMEAERYTSRDEPMTNHLSCMALYMQNPGGAPDGSDVLRRLEEVLMEGYDYAREHGMVYLPYQVAWARLYEQNPELVREVVAGKQSDWLNYMLASMAYTTLTGRYQPALERLRPRVVNKEHPYGYHEICGRVGYETVRQLATLSKSVNTIVLRTENYRVDNYNPGFVAVRLLERPEAAVTVVCALDRDGVAELSRSELLFTPENFDIEQTIRVSPAEQGGAVRFNFMAAAHSSDRGVDGASDQRPMLLNSGEGVDPGYGFAARVVSPASGYALLLAPDGDPLELTGVSIVRHGVKVAEHFFSFDHTAPQRVLIYPTAAEYERGELEVTVVATPLERPTREKRMVYNIAVSSSGEVVPQVEIAEPAEGAVIEGPAFVQGVVRAAVEGGVAWSGLYLGQKRVGRVAGGECQAALEMGPPQSRLGVGSYTLWGVAGGSNGVWVATPPQGFEVRGR